MTELARQPFHTTGKSQAKRFALFFVKQAYLKMYSANFNIALRGNG
jgi:hypothetical protein